MSECSYLWRDNEEKACVFLTIATNIPQWHKTGFVVQGHICLAFKVSARFSRSIFSGTEFGSNWYGNIDATLNYTGADGTCGFGKGCGSTETLSKLFTNHDTRETANQSQNIPFLKKAGLHQTWN